MGWCSGSEVMAEVIAAVMRKVTDESARKQIYLDLIPVFEAEDCDTLRECMGVDVAYDDAMDELDPRGDDEEDES